MIKILFTSLIVQLLFNQAFINAAQYVVGVNDTANFETSGTSWNYTNNWNSGSNYDFKGIKGTMIAGANGIVGNPFKLSITHSLKKPTKIDEHTFTNDYLTQNENWETANSGLIAYTASTGRNQIQIVLDANDIITQESYKKLDDASAYALLKDKEMVMFAITDKTGNLTSELSTSINNTKNTAEVINGNLKNLTLFMFKDHIEEKKEAKGSETARYSLLSGGTVTYKINNDNDNTNKATFGK